MIPSANTTTLEGGGGGGSSTSDITVQDWKQTECKHTANEKRDLSPDLLFQQRPQPAHRRASRLVWCQLTDGEVVCPWGRRGEG